MANRSKIEWTDATWNPIVGCSVTSPGCTNCYAMKFAGTRLAHIPRYAGLTVPSKAGPVWNGSVRLVEEALTQSLRWKKPRRIFVNSMSDLFHEDVPDEWIDRVFAVMALTRQHTFQVLTKRADRMRTYLENPDRVWSIFGAIRKYINDEYRANARFEVDETPFVWPLPNVWLGVSCEDQLRAEERIPALLDTPAAVRFVSAEPLLGPIDYRRWLEMGGLDTDLGLSNPGLDWIIVGGESGPGARPMHPQWARSIRDQCVAAGVPFLFKQHGEWKTVYDRDHDDPDWRNCPRAANSNERYVNLAGGHGFHGKRVIFMRKIGKKAAGRELDGVTHDGYPEACHAA